MQMFCILFKEESKQCKFMAYLAQSQLTSNVNEVYWGIVLSSLVTEVWLLAASL